MSHESFLSRALRYLLTKTEHSVEADDQKPESAEGKMEAQTSIKTETTSPKSEEDKSKGDPRPQSSADNSNFTQKDYHSYVDQKTLFTPDNIMRALGVEILESGGDGYYLVGFQGGAFVFYFEGDRLNVMYNDVVECSFTDSVKAAFVANDINGEYAVWSCYLRASKRGTSTKPVKVCFSQMFPLGGNFKQTTEFIHGVLASAFSVAREFREKYKQALQDDSNLANTLNKKDFMNKLEFAKRLIEVGNFDEMHEEMPPASYLRVDSLADLFDDTEFGEPCSMRILADDELELITEPAVVETFDVRAYIRNHPKRDELENLTLVVKFEKQNLVVSLNKMPGSTDKSLFFVLNVLRSGTEADLFSRNMSAVSCRATVEIRLTSDQEDYWEVKYMIDDARDKHAKNDISSMTEEQKMMLIQIAPNVQDDFYWGVKYFNENCWYQSLYYFKRIFYNYARQDAKHKRRQEIVSDICLYLGITYYHLKMYDRAYYYLDRSRKYDSVIASEWFVNCLCSMHDPMAFHYVKKMLETVTYDLEETDGRLQQDVESEYYTFYLFLKRKLVQILIADWRLDEAEELLFKMIDMNENKEFAQRELASIHQIRKEQAEQDAKARQKVQGDAKNDEPREGDSAKE